MILWVPEKRSSDFVGSFHEDFNFESMNEDVICFGGVGGICDSLRLCED